MLLFDDKTPALAALPDFFCTAALSEAPMWTQLRKPGTVLLGLHRLATPRSPSDSHSAQDDPTHSGACSEDWPLCG